jgi:hypothetical protein
MVVVEKALLLLRNKVRRMPLYESRIARHSIGRLGSESESSQFEVNGCVEYWDLMFADAVVVRGEPAVKARLRNIEENDHDADAFKHHTIDFVHVDE